MDRSPGLGGKACIRVSTPSQQVSKWLRALGDCCRVCWPPGGVSLQNGALLFLPLVYPVHSSWCSSRRRVPTLPLTLPTLPWTSHLTPTWKSFDKVHKISIRGKLYPLINSPHKNLYIIVMLSIIIQNMLTLSSRIAKMLSALQQSLCPPFRYVRLTIFVFAIYSHGSAAVVQWLYSRMRVHGVIVYGKSPWG
jgi:hypothetical protein